jgi:DNA-binding Lrp family transcriptional regulator
VTAFCTLEIRQRQGHAPVVAHLSAIPEVLEIHSITGVGDLIVRVVARDNADLGRVIDEIIDDVHVIRANTSMCLVTHLDHRTGPLVEAVRDPSGPRLSPMPGCGVGVPCTGPQPPQPGIGRESCCVALG